MKIVFHKNGWEDYLFWQKQSKKELKRVNDLIRECQRTPFEGSGKPERLKHTLSGFWSRRIDSEHRLVYAVKAIKNKKGEVIDKELHILTARYHY